MCQINQYFYPNGQVVKSGQLLKNPKLATVYRTLAKEGISPFYQGVIAKKIVAAVQQSTIAPGKLTLADMESYQAIEREPVCGDYQQRDTTQSSRSGNCWRPWKF